MPPPPRFALEGVFSVYLRCEGVEVGDDSRHRHDVNEEGPQEVVREMSSDYRPDTRETGTKLQSPDINTKLSALVILETIQM